MRGFVAACGLALLMVDAKATRRGRRVLLDLRGRPAGDVCVRIAVRYRLRGRTRQVTERRSYRLCAAAFH